MKDAINAVAGTTGITASFDGSSKAALILTDADGDNIELIDNFNNTATVAATVSLQAMDYEASAVSGTAQSLDTTDDGTVITGTVRMEAAGAFTASGQTW